jgi:hypothetical protein
MWLFKFDNLKLPNFIFLIEYVFNFYGINFPPENYTFGANDCTQVFLTLFLPNSSRFCKIYLQRKQGVT